MKYTYLSLLTHICHTSTKPFHYCELFVLQLPMSAVVPSSGNHYAIQGCTNIPFKFPHLAFGSPGYLPLVIVDPLPLCPIGGSRALSGISCMCFCRKEVSVIMSMMTLTVLQLSRRVRRVALQIEKLCGGKAKVAYNVQRTASMVSNRICDRFDTKAIRDQLLKIFINLTRPCYRMS
jgi:hypothetical protein